MDTCSALDVTKGARSITPAKRRLCISTVHFKLSHQIQKAHHETGTHLLKWAQLASAHPTDSMTYPHFIMFDSCPKSQPQTAPAFEQWRTASFSCCVYTDLKLFPVGLSPKYSHTSWHSGCHASEATEAIPYHKQQ